MFGLGAPELIVVGIIALLVFGNRVPEVMRSFGRSVSEFKKGISGVQDELEQIKRVPPLV